MPLMGSSAEMIQTKNDFSELENMSIETSKTEKQKEKKREKIRTEYSRIVGQGFPGGAVVENLPANAGDTGSSPGLGRSHMPRSN